MVRGVEVCGRSEVCGWGGVDVGGGSHVCASIVYRCSHMCIVCVCVCALLIHTMSCMCHAAGWSRVLISGLKMLSCTIW